MHELDSQDAYDELVQNLTTELSDEIRGDGEITESIARQVMVGVSIRSGKPFMQVAAIYEGGGLETIDEGLRPTDVLAYTHAENLTAPPAGETVNLWEQAVDALATDMNHAYRKQAEAAQHG